LIFKVLSNSEKTWHELSRQDARVPGTTHPSEKAHGIWARAIIPKLKEMMGK